MAQIQIPFTVGMVAYACNSGIQEAEAEFTASLRLAWAT